MRIPVIKGLIRRRMLINYRAEAGVVERILPSPFRPKLHEGWAIVGVCLIRLESIRPAGIPDIVGHSSENAAHRIAVEWSDEEGAVREGVFIPRRDTGSVLNLVAGGRLFPGEHYLADFEVQEDARRIHFKMESKDGKVRVVVAGEESDRWFSSSCFRSLDDASSFFEGGSVGYSVTHDVNRFDGLRLKTVGWRATALKVTEVFSSFFEDRRVFPEGTIEFDHALIMRDLAHEWHLEEDLYQALRE